MQCSTHKVIHSHRVNANFRTEVKRSESDMNRIVSDFVPILFTCKYAVCARTRARVCVCVCVCVCEPCQRSLSLSLSLSLYFSIFLYFCLCVCVSLCLCVCVCLSLYLSTQFAKLRELSVQGRWWLEWTDVMHSDLSWRRLLHGIDDGEHSFTFRAIPNTLATPDNLHHWGQQTTDPVCSLCGRQATLGIILNGCKLSVSLHHGRYTWRHNNILRTLQTSLDQVLGVCQMTGHPALCGAPFHPSGSTRLFPTAKRQRSRHARPLLMNDALRCAREVGKFCLMLIEAIQHSLFK